MTADPQSTPRWTHFFSDSLAALCGEILVLQGSTLRHDPAMAQYIASCLKGFNGAIAQDIMHAFMDVLGIAVPEDQDRLSDISLGAASLYTKAATEMIMADRGVPVVSYQFGQKAAKEEGRVPLPLKTLITPRENLRLRIMLYRTLEKWLNDDFGLPGTAKKRYRHALREALNLKQDALFQQKDVRPLQAHFTHGEDQALHTLYQLNLLLAVGNGVIKTHGHAFRDDPLDDAEWKAVHPFASLTCLQHYARRDIRFWHNDSQLDAFSRMHLLMLALAVNDQEPLPVETALDFENLHVNLRREGFVMGALQLLPEAIAAYRAQRPDIRFENLTALFAPKAGARLAERIQAVFEAPLNPAHRLCPKG